MMPIKLPIDVGNYPYVCARVKAKKGLLLPPETYTKLLQMEIPQISRFLGEGQYKEEILALGAKYSGVDLIEMATRDNLAKVFTQIIDFSEGQLKTMISRYLDRWDLWNVKTILRGKFYGASSKEIFEDLVPAGSFTTSFLQELVGKETVEEIMEGLEGTIYHKALDQLGEDFKEMKTLAPFEDTLSHVYYSALLEAIPPTTDPNRFFLLFVRREIDILNVKTLLRVRGERATLERDVFVDGGLELDKEDLKEMVSLDLDSLAKRLQDYSFYEKISAELKAVETKGLNEVMRSLEKYLLSEASRYSHIHPLSVLPVLDFIVAKEKEVDNVRIIARGKESELAGEVIKELLVI